MLSIRTQLESARLVCPVTHQPLHFVAGGVETADGTHRYPLVNGVPILFSDPQRQKQYLEQEDGAMNREYLTASKPNRLKSLARYLVNLDYRPEANREGFRQTVSCMPSDALCLSIGGGPAREHPNLCNMNIGAFPNVDVVADAYELPYADGAVDAVFCEAVLEHLEFPQKAVEEMWRVLRQGGQVFAATPFLQWYHAYPNHFQNFTLTGHERLFVRAGFNIISSGTSVGPMVALSVLMANFAKTFMPFRPLKRLTGWLCAILAIPIRSLDLWFNKNPQSHSLASATYVHAVKSVS